MKVKKKKPQQVDTNKIVLVTVLLNLIRALIELVNKLIE